MPNLTESLRSQVKLLRPAVILGTRPEAIKMAAIVKELKRCPFTSPIVVATAQHREMLDQVLQVFSIKLDYDLDIMGEDQSPIDVVQQASSGLSQVFKETSPDIVLVQGDTTTAFITALVAFYQRIPIGHIEAGLRTYDKYNPYPEEGNRRMISAIADLHFAPTVTNRRNLLAEGIKEEDIYVTGNTVIDSLLMVSARQRDASALSHLGQHNRRVILVTAHRRENWGKPLEDICFALKRLVELYPDIEIVYPVHLNPNVYKPVHTLLGRTPRIHLIAPLPYELFVQMMNKAYLILTDSGGIQEEAPALKKPVLVLRAVTERPDGVEAGTVKVVGTNRDDIVRATSHLLDDEEEYQRMARAVNPYGDGKAAQRITEALLYHFGLTDKRPLEFK